MADIVQAAKWLKEGKRVRISDWEEGQYMWERARGIYCTDFYGEGGEPMNFSSSDLLSGDWEIAG